MDDTPRTDDAISLTTASLNLQLTYEQTRRHVQKGDLVGGRDSNGWWVSAASAKAFNTRRQEAR